MSVVLKREFFIIGLMFILGAIAMFFYLKQTQPVPKQQSWRFQSIDTMKSSRDQAREMLRNTHASRDIDRQMKAIAETGATHVAIGTPYDDEFLPILKAWSRSARKYGLHVWYRGNWSGWEGWFDYKRIDEETHIQSTKKFILDNSNLFEDGDIFTSCPECENGKKLETGNSQAIVQHRQFLIKEYQSTKEAFKTIDKRVTANYYSMNADVARLVMDPTTTDALDGVVTIDHYVKTPEQLARDVALLSEQTGGRIVLGEIGAPIPDIHGQMTEVEQAGWIAEAFKLLSKMPEVEGVNYWVNEGGSTALWRPDHTPKPIVPIITNYFGGK